MSLYSSQLVVAARQQLSKQLQQKAALQNHQTAKIEKHRPYHYGQTVHQKCKHHGQTKQGLIHKKIHEHIDHAKEKQNQLEHAQNHRRLEDERQEISAEMKKWTKVIEKCLSGQHKFTERQLHEQHSGFYKWMLFVEELFRHYQNSLKTQTSIHNLDHQQHKSDKLLGESAEILPSPKVQHKDNDPHQIKLPHLPTKQRVLNCILRNDCNADILIKSPLAKNKMIDQNTVDILRHKNITQFKHKSGHENKQDFEAMMREIELQKDETVKQMKVWTRILQSATKGQVGFSQNDYFQLKNSFYKWLLFIQQSYSSYQKIQNTLPPQLVHQSPNNIHSKHHYNEELVRKSHATTTKSQKQTHEKEIRKLNLIITDLQSQIDVKKIKLSNSQLKIQSMGLRVAELQDILKKHELREKEVNKKILSVITESQQFLLQLKKSIAESKDLKPFIQIIDQKRSSLKEYRSSLK